ncbi:uncharacterized protein [Henckelia pumila]|uniref:uncharacterized protein n=1 Tax=Henckelia pumila TaxID=405737 RepID=UPI003C6E0684
MAEEGEQTSSKHGSSRTYWSTKDVKLFIDILLEYKRKGEMRNNNFGKSWTKICKDFNSKAEFRQTQEQMSQKFNRFRADWRVFKDLCDYTGLGWDSVNETVTASEEQWADLIKKNKEFKKFKSRGLEFNKELAKIFQKSSSTGNFAFASGQSQVNEDLEVNANTSLGFDDEEVPLTTKSSTKRPILDTASSTKQEGSRGKKARKSTYNEDLYLEAATQACIAKANRYNAQITPTVDEYSSEKCMDALYELEDDIDDDIFFVKAAKSFVDPTWRPIFMKMARRHRLAWIKSL